MGFNYALGLGAGDKFDVKCEKIGLHENREHLPIRCIKQEIVYSRCFFDWKANLVDDFEHSFLNFMAERSSPLLRAHDSVAFYSPFLSSTCHRAINLLPSAHKNRRTCWGQPEVSPASCENPETNFCQIGFDEAIKQISIIVTFSVRVSWFRSRSKWFLRSRSCSQWISSLRRL